MSPTTIKLKSKVLPGKRVVVESNELVVGEVIDVLISRSTIVPNEHKSRYKSMVEIVASTPEFRRTPDQWRERERSIQEEKNSWDR